MTNIPLETKQNGSAHEYKFYCYFKASELNKSNFISHMFQTYLLRKIVVGSYF